MRAMGSGRRKCFEDGRSSKQKSSLTVVVVLLYRETYWKFTGNVWEKYGKNGLMTGHLRPFRAIGSIGNEFAASISSSLSPPRPPQAFPRAIFRKSGLQLDYKIAYKPTFELITGLRHYSSWIRLVLLCRFMLSIRFLAF